ncbi:hypothetical protein SEA_FIZZLES_77 [Microbacterium phage Fizzles]|nr:hypothetical protein SEA_FIZZLES_77 [Microbacterium phage Fizzles]
MPIRAVTKDGVVEFSPETFERFEIDLTNGQTLWVEKPVVVWYLNDELAAPIFIMGGPGAITHFHPHGGNGLLAAALKEQRATAREEPQ